MTMARRRKVAKVIKDVAMETFTQWVSPRLSVFRHRERRGVRKGDPLGLQSREAFYLAQLQALHSPIAELFTVSELAEFGHTSETALKFLRTESHFKEIATHAAWQFADHVIDVILNLTSDEDYYKRRILIEVLVLLPGFDIFDNQFFETLWEIMDIISHKFQYHERTHEHINAECAGLLKDNYTKLLNCLQRYDDVLTFVWEMTPDHKRRAFAEKANSKVESGLKKESIEILLSKGKEAGVISEDLASWINNVLAELGRMTFYAYNVIWMPEKKS
jgi:hypothetical protein